MRTNALDIVHFTKQYGTRTAVNDMSLSIPEGAFFGLLGPNGAGKTSTIHAITGIAKITSGTISIFGSNVVSEYRRARMLVGLSPQEFNVDIFAKVEDILWIVGGYYGIPRKERDKRVTELLEQFQLTEYAKKKFQHLSGGLKRRVVMAKALIHHPKVLILDEPTAGIDVELRREIWKYLRQLNKEGITIILTSHYLEEIEQLCDSVAIMVEGSIIINAPISNILQKGQSLEDVYMDITQKNHHA